MPVTTGSTSRADARTGDGGTLLEACAAQVLRARPHRRQCPPGKDRAADLADRFKAVKRFDLLFDIVRDNNSLADAERFAARQERGYSPIWKNGCDENGPNSRDMRLPPR